MRSWKTPLIYCVSLMVCFCAGIAIDLACGGEVDPYDYYVSFFHNNLQGEKGYKPFYFTNYQFVYDENEPASEAEVNADEWSEYLGKDITAADVGRAMYHLSPHTDSVLLYGYLKLAGKLPDSLADNTFLLQLKKNPAALKYYRFVKDVEMEVKSGYDKWDPKPTDSTALRAAGTLAFKSALTEKDKFLKLRYYYQAQRLLHYCYNYKDAASIYDKYIAPYPSASHVKGWAMGLKAGELRRLKDKVHSAYLFSKVFGQYPERRVQAYRNYKYLDLKAQQVAPLAVTNSEKAFIYAIDGFGDPELNLSYLEKVYQLDPASPMVGVLLVREVNKLEEKYLTPGLLKRNKAIMTDYYPEGTDQKELSTRNYMNQLSAFCRQLTIERKYVDYNIANLAGAYIAWMQGDNAGGTYFLRVLGKENLTPSMNDQKQIIQLLVSAQNIQKLNDINELQLLPSLKWLDEKAHAEGTKGKDSVFSIPVDRKFTNTESDFYQQILAPAYLKQGDTTKAALALLKSPKQNAMDDFSQNYLHSANVVRIIRWKKTAPVVPYLNFLASSLSNVKLDYLYELLGTTYLREHQYGKAINALKEVTPAYLNSNPEDFYKGDPFIDRINDYPKILRYGKTTGYNKLQFAEAMNETELKIQTDKQNTPSYYYRLATGLYNTSHYGNAPYLISYNWTSGDYGRANKYSYDVDYIRTKTAEKYYLLARSLSGNEEFKAKCTFMAAKCKQKQFVMPQYGGPNYDEASKDYFLQLKSNQYFDELKSNYRKTDIFKKAVGECSYLKDFMLTGK